MRQPISLSTGDLALHLRIGRLELSDFDDLLIRHELDEVPMVLVRMGRRLAGSSSCVLRERDAERTTFAGAKRMHMTGHAVRHHPCRDRLCIDKRTIDVCATRHHVLTETRDNGSQNSNLLGMFALRLSREGS